MECVELDTLPRIRFDPSLITTAIPMVARKRNGSNHEPHIKSRIASNMTNTTIYTENGIVGRLVSSFFHTTL